MPFGVLQPVGRRPLPWRQRFFARRQTEVALSDGTDELRRLNRQAHQDLMRRLRWTPEIGCLFHDDAYHCRGIRLEQVLEELISRLCSNAVWVERSRREITKIARDNHLRAGVDRRGKNMAALRIVRQQRCDG
jgi:hypothetical protein